MKCGLAANTSATKATETNKNIDTDDKIRNFICFMTVILAVIKTKAVCFNFYFNKDFKQSKQIIARAGRKITEIFNGFFKFSGVMIYILCVQIRNC